MADSVAPVRDRSPSWRTIAFFALAAALFLLVNQASYKGFFFGDDLNTLTWARAGDVPVFLSWLVTPRISDANFRPVGAFYYRILGSTVGFWYPPYVVVLQAIHLANVILLFLILRRLRLPWLACAAGALFFLFHLATIDNYWKPMYVFDLLCGTFCLLTLLLYMDGRWIWGIVTFWLAFKSKEVAVMLPVVLATYEAFFGSWRWKRLIPYLLISLNFGLQGVLTHAHTDDGYTLRLTSAGLSATSSYYATELFFNPYVCLAVIVILAIARDRRVYFGALMALLLLVPMLLLPGRLFSAYWYVPLVGVSICVAALCSSTPRWLVVAGLALWFLGNYTLLLEKEKAILAAADDNRTYFYTLAELAKRDPSVRALGYKDYPQEMYVWGVEGAATLLFGPDAHVYPASSAEWQTVSHQGNACLLEWRSDSRSLATSCIPREEGKLQSSR